MWKFLPARDHGTNRGASQVSRSGYKRPCCSCAATATSDVFATALFQPADMESVDQAHRAFGALARRDDLDAPQALEILRGRSDDLELVQAGGVVRLDPDIG